MPNPIRVAILEDHQSIIDGYIYRLKADPEIQVVWTAPYGEELEPMLNRQPVDVLLLDINVPVSPENSNPFPILYAVPDLFQKHSELSILVISMVAQHNMIEALVDAGISGYIFKDDRESIRRLAKIVTMVADGGIYFSQEAYQRLREAKSSPATPILTTRQLEAISLCAAYPDDSTAQLAARMGVANSTLRNLLSNAYLRLGRSTRASAIARIRKLGLTPSSLPDMEIKAKKDS